MNTRHLQVIVPQEAARLITVVGLVRAGQPMLALVVLLTTVNQGCWCTRHHLPSTPGPQDAANR